MRGMKNLQLECLVLGEAATNCYLAKNRQTGALLIIDPGDEEGLIREKIAGMGGTPEAVLLTHGHYDHIGAAEAIRKDYDIPVCAIREEQEVLTDVEKNMTLWHGDAYTLQADRFFRDGEQVTLAGFSIRVLHTPGHTIGSACYYLPEESVLFSGDTLFRCSVGRTDFPTGSMTAMHRSIHEKLFELPEETKVYPGHEEMTGIRYEKRYNPY